MYKIKSLTKDDKLFSILLICFLLFDYFIILLLDILYCGFSIHFSWQQELTI